MRLLYSSEAISERLATLAHEIDADYGTRQLVLVGVLKGAVPFLCDLARELSVEHTLDYCRVSSYGAGHVSSGHATLGDAWKLPLGGRHVLLVDDICDSGLTLSTLEQMVREQGAASVATCVLLDKPSRRTVDFVPRYVGFSIDDVFVVGYGMDDNERYRSLASIAVVEEDDHA